MTKVLLSALIYIVLITGVFTANYEDEEKKFTQGNEFFTEYFLSVASNMNPEISAIYSPFSLIFLIAQLALYAAGSTLDQLLVPINISKQEIPSAISQYLTELNSQQNVNISLAERVYVNEKYKLTAGFINDTREIFHAEGKNLDFSNSFESANDINSWVAEQTHNLIPSIVEQRDLTEDTRVVLVDAIYFKANWRKPFKTYNTQQLDFYVDKNKNVTVSMMYQEETFNYAELSDAQVVQLPYKNANFTLIVCLPKSKDGLSELISSIGDTSFSFLKDIQTKLAPQTVALSFPSIKTSTTSDLKEILEKMNITDIFDSSTSNLTGILEVPEPLYVSTARQKATITLDENGTEAAAANVISISATAAIISPQETVKFNADHPFAYVIMYKDTPIFCGVYAAIVISSLSEVIYESEPIVSNADDNKDHRFAYFIMYNVALNFGVSAGL